jgi:CDP-diacylglycerol--glycerol-3-phosphate 3-phosphatidyltransferase
MNNLANMLTVTRLALLPFIIALLYVTADWAAWTVLVLYIVGALTDWLDGWVARKYNQVSEFGKFMDPISDKIFVVTLLMMLVATQRIEHFLVLAVIVILIREFLVSGIREFLGPKGVKLPVTKLAKWKTAIQMIATGLLIVGPSSDVLDITGGVLLCAASALTVITGWVYVRSAWQYLH